MSPSPGRPDGNGRDDVIVGAKGSDLPLYWNENTDASRERYDMATTPHLEAGGVLGESPNPQHFVYRNLGDGEFAVDDLELLVAADAAVFQAGSHADR